MEEASVKKLTESDIVLPNDFDSTIRALGIKKGIINIFFDDDAYAIRQIAEVQQKRKKTRNQIEMMKQSNPDIYMEILYMIDTRFNDWLKQCARYSDEVHAIDHGFIDFDDIIKASQDELLLPAPPLKFQKLDKYLEQLVPIIGNKNQVRKGAEEMAKQILGK